MKVLAVIVVLIVVCVIFALAVAWLNRALEDRSKRRREVKLKDAAWEPTTYTEPDGTMIVAIKKAGNKARVVKELPPGIDSAEFQAELRIAVEDAELQARAANREM